MIKLNLLQTLVLEQASHKDRHAHLSAASGLVSVGDWLYVIADDENHLGVFNRKGTQPGKLKSLLPGELAIDYEKRKEQKPDFEVLTFIPPSIIHPYGALLALGSGSKKNRHHGIILELDSQGIVKQIDIINLEKFYDLLKDDMEKINLEGAVILGSDLLLFHRGNKKNKVNASIRLSFADFYRATVHADKKTLASLRPCIQAYELGAIANVPLCFTDATPLPNGSILFTATAENTDDAYLDGKCMGSSIGIIDQQGTLQEIIPVNETVKIEGITATLNSDKVELLLVTDADDATLAAHLYSAEIPGYPFATKI